jgi:hypothetical protein
MSSIGSSTESPFLSVRNGIVAAVTTAAAYGAHKVQEFCTPEVIPAGWIVNSHLGENGPVCSFIDEHPLFTLAATGLAAGFLALQIARRNHAPVKREEKPDDAAAAVNIDGLKRVVDDSADLHAVPEGSDSGEDEVLDSVLDKK